MKDKMEGEEREIKCSDVKGREVNEWRKKTKIRMKDRVGQKLKIIRGCVYMLVLTEKFVTEFESSKF
jgi:hypothetical protein